MFQALRVHGKAGTILWGYRPAATLRSWSIIKHNGRWVLKGVIARADAFQCRQRPLLFTAPREGARDGFWAWQVDGELQLNKDQLVATLGPPEQ